MRPRTVARCAVPLWVAVGCAAGWADEAPTSTSPLALRLAGQVRAEAQLGHCAIAANAFDRLTSLDAGLAAVTRQDPAIADCLRPSSLALPPTGTRLRIRLASGPVTGRLAGIDGDMLLVERDGAAAARIPIRSMRALEARTGQRRRSRAGLGWGLLVGTAVGIGITGALGRGGDENDFFLEYTLLPPMALGAIVGGLIGTAITTDTWQPVKLDRAPVAPPPR